VSCSLPTASGNSSEVMASLPATASRRSTAFHREGQGSNGCLPDSPRSGGFVRLWCPLKMPPLYCTLSAFVGLGGLDKRYNQNERFCC
jgi:hypothetical protein